jgi:hypothetical protein
MPPNVVINPRDDTAFVDAVETERQSAGSPEALEDVLRAAYPDTVVRPRQLDGERSRIWYVYRDGHWVMPR